MEDYRRLRESFGVLALPDFGLVRLSGADVLEWLQGQVTNDVRPLSSGQSVSFCLCSATGQIESVVDAFPDGSSILLSLPRVTVGTILRRVQEMVVMEEVEADELPLQLVTVQGPSARESGVPEAAHRFENDRSGSGGIDFWFDRDSALPGPTVGAEALDLARLEAGIPVFGRDIREKTLPPEMGPAFESRHVSYTKGCYVGQEILQRIHSRGHTNRTWVGLILDRQVEAGSPVSHESRADAGVVTGAGVSPTLGPIAAAVLRNEAAFPGSRVSVAGAAGVVREMPLLSFGG